MKTNLSMPSKIYVKEIEMFTFSVKKSSGYIFTEKYALSIFTLYRKIACI